MDPLLNFIQPCSAGRLQSFDACHVALDKRSLLVKFLAADMAVFVLAPSNVFAANQTWSNTGTVSGNWSAIPVPRVTSGSTTNDVATFNTLSGNYGTSESPVIIDGYHNISGLAIQRLGRQLHDRHHECNALNMSSGGIILLSSGLTTANTTINAPLLMNGTLTINNTAPNSSNNFGSAKIRSLSRHNRKLSGGSAIFITLTPV